MRVDDADAVLLLPLSYGDEGKRDGLSETPCFGIILGCCGALIAYSIDAFRGSSLCVQSFSFSVIEISG